MRIRNRILVSLLSHKKLNYNILKVVNRSKKHTYEYEGTKAFMKGRKPGLLLNFGQFLCSWIRIRIPNTDTDPEPRLKTAKRMRIQVDPDPQHRYRTKFCKLPT